MAEEYQYIGPGESSEEYVYMPPVKGDVSDTSVAGNLLTVPMGQGSSSSGLGKVIEKAGNWMGGMLTPNTPPPPVTGTASMFTPSQDQTPPLQSWGKWGERQQPVAPPPSPRSLMPADIYNHPFFSIPRAGSEGVINAFKQVPEALGAVTEWWAEYNKGKTGAETVAEWGKATKDYWGEKVKEGMIASGAPSSFTDIKTPSDFGKWAAYNIGNSIGQIATTIPFMAIPGGGEVVAGQKVSQAASKTARVGKWLADWVKFKPMDAPLALLEGGEIAKGQLEKKAKGEIDDLSLTKLLAGSFIAAKLEELGDMTGVSKLFARRVVKEFGRQVPSLSAKLYRIGKTALKISGTEYATEFFQTYAETLGIDPKDMLTYQTFMEAVNAGAAGAVGGLVVGGGLGVIEGKKADVPPPPAPVKDGEMGIPVTPVQTEAIEPPPPPAPIEAASPSPTPPPVSTEAPVETPIPTEPPPISTGVESTSVSPPPIPVEPPPTPAPVSPPSQVGGGTTPIPSRKRVYHYTKPENIPSIQESGFDTERPPLHGIGRSNLHLGYTKADKVGKDVLYFTTDKDRWGEATEYTGENKGEKDYTYYDYDTQQYVTQKKATRSASLEAVEADIKEDANVLTIDSLDAYMAFQRQHFGNAFPRDRLGEVIDKAKELGYDVVNFQHKNGSWAFSDNRVNRYGETDWYKDATGNGGKDDYFVLNKDAIEIVGKKPTTGGEVNAPIQEEVPTEATPVEGEITPPEPRREVGTVTIKEANIQKYRKALDKSTQDAHNALYDSDALANHPSYDRSFPIPESGGLIAARDSEKYRKNPEYAETIDSLIQEMQDIIVTANRKRMLLDQREGNPGFGVAYSIAPESKVRATYQVNVARAWNMEAKAKYPDAHYLGSVAIREGLQNSLDAVLGALEQKQIKEGLIEFDVLSKQYTISDNGIGMSDTDIRDKFLALHGTGKDVEGRFGGFGVAKAVILGPSESASWTLHTRDNWFTGEMASNNEVIETKPYRQGTQLTVTNDEVVVDERAHQYVQATEVPKNIKVVYNGKPVKNPFTGLRKKTQSHTLDSNTTLEITYYPQAPDGFDQTVTIRLVDAKTQSKLTQSIRNIWSSGFKGAVMVDIKTKATPGMREYPLTGSRMEMKYDAYKPVQELIARYSKDSTSSQRVGQKAKTYRIQYRPEWKETLFKLGSDKGYQNVVNTINNIFKTTGNFFGDHDRPFTPLHVLDVQIDEGYKGYFGGSMFHAKHLAAYEAVARLLSNAAQSSMHTFYGLISKPIDGAIVRSEYMGGLHGHNFVQIDKTALKSPEAYALYLKQLVDHELTHGHVGAHDESFSMMREKTGNRTAHLFPHILRIAEAVLGKEGEVRTKAGQDRVIEKPVVEYRYRDRIVEGSDKAKTERSSIPPQQLDLFDQMEQGGYDDARIKLYTPEPKGTSRQEGLFQGEPGRDPNRRDSETGGTRSGSSIQQSNPQSTRESGARSMEVSEKSGRGKRESEVTKIPVDYVGVQQNLPGKPPYILVNKADKSTVVFKPDTMEIVGGKKKFQKEAAHLLPGEKSTTDSEKGKITNWTREDVRKAIAEDRPFPGDVISDFPDLQEEIIAKQEKDHPSPIPEPTVITKPDGGKTYFYANPFAFIGDLYTDNIGRPLSKWAIRHLPKSVREFGSPTSTIVGSNWYLDIRSKSKGFLDRSEDFVNKLFDDIGKFTADQRRDMFRAITQDSITAANQAISQLPVDQARAARRYISAMDRIGKMLVRRGMISEETFNANKGHYIHYMYLKHILGDDSAITVGAGGKINTGILKQRKDLTVAQRRAIGLVEDLDIAGRVGMLHALKNVAMYDFFNEVKTRWAWRPTTQVFQGKRWKIADLEKELEKQLLTVGKNPTNEAKARLYDLEQAMANAMARAGHSKPKAFTQIPNTKSYGPLRGQFIPTPIARDLIPIRGRFAEPADIGGRSWNFAIDLLESSMTGFKVFKTALNIPTGVRNMGSNFVQLNMSGIPWYEIPIRIGQALHQMGTHGPLFTQAKRAGIFRSNWAQGEIEEALSMIRKNGYNPMETIRSLAKFYGKIDDVGKLAKFIEQRQAGKSAKEAAREANKWGMDYSLASRSVKVARRFVIPFGSYTYKIAPLLLESAIERPWILAKWIAVPSMMAAYAMSQFDLDEDDWKKLKNTLPLWLQRNQSYVPLWWKSPDGDVQWINMEYFFPAQQFIAIYRDLVNQEYGDIVRDVGMSNPIADIYTVAMTMKGDNPPRDPYTNKEIFNALDAPNEKALKTFQWAYNKWAPSMLADLPSLIANATGLSEVMPQSGTAALTYRMLTEQPDRYGRTVTPGQASSSLVGLNVVSPTPAQAYKERKALEFKARSDLSYIIKDPTLSPEKKADTYRRYAERLRKIRRGEDREDEEDE